MWYLTLENDPQSQDPSHYEDLDLPQLQEILAREIEKPFNAILIGRWKMAWGTWRSDSEFGVAYNGDTAVAFYTDTSKRNWSSYNLQMVEEPDRAELVSLFPENAVELVFPAYMLISKQSALRTLQEYIAGADHFKGLYSIEDDKPQKEHANR